MKHLKQSTIVYITPLLIAFMLLTQCVVPYESARMLPKGATEVKVAYSHVRFTEGKESEKVDDGLGIGIGYGISNKLNLKFRYENFSNEGSANFFGLAPKLALVQDRIAAALPVGVYFDEGETEWVISPMMFFTLPNASNTFEATLGLRADKFFEEDTDLLLGLNLGLGFSQDLNRWAIRPDVGFIFSPGNEGSYLTLGLGASYNFTARSSGK